MFKIIEKTIKEPIRMLAKPGVKFKAGNIVRISEYMGEIVVDLAEGNSAFGIVGSNRKTKSSKISYSPKDMVKIWNQRMVIRLSQFDTHCKYQAGNPLFVGKGGIFITEKINEDMICIARVITGPTSDKAFLDALWL